MLEASVSLVSQIRVVEKNTNIGTFLIRSRGAETEIINCVLIGELSKTADWHSEKMVVMRYLKLNWLDTDTLSIVDNIALCSRRYFCVTPAKPEPFVFCCLVIVAILHWQLMSLSAGQRRSYHEQLRGGLFVNPGDVILNPLDPWWRHQKHFVKNKPFKEKCDVVTKPCTCSCGLWHHWDQDLDFLLLRSPEPQHVIEPDKKNLISPLIPERANACRFYFLMRWVLWAHL